MRYDYKCDECGHEFITNHGMNEKPKVICPKCNKLSHQIFKSIPEFYVRGYGYCDRAGCKRDMNLYKMTHGDDPYKRYRERGEADNLTSELRKGGKFNPKRRHFVPKSGKKK